MRQTDIDCDAVELEIARESCGSSRSSCQSTCHSRSAYVLLGMSMSGERLAFFFLVVRLRLLGYAGYTPGGRGHAEKNGTAHSHPARDGHPLRHFFFWHAAKRTLHNRKLAYSVGNQNGGSCTPKTD